MKKRSYTKLGAIAVVALLAGQAQAAEVMFTALESTDFTTATNWSTFAYPTTADYARVDTTADLTNATPNNILALRIGEIGADSVGVLNVTGTNAYINANSSSNWDSHIGRQGHGTLNILEGGQAYINFAEIGREPGATGIVNVVEGYLRFTRGSRKSGGWSLHIGANDHSGGAGYGEVNVSGGQFLTRFGVELGHPTREGNIGTFNVQGTNATEITIGDTNDGRWDQYTNSTLRAGIDGGVTPITVKNHGGGGNVFFQKGAILDVGFINGYSANGTWVVMIAEGSIVNLGLELSATAVAAGWNAGIEGNVLRVAFGEDAPGDLNPPTTPLEPGTLLAHPTGPNAATLTWGEAVAAETYIIKRSTSIGGPYTEVATGVAGLTYEDSGLTHGTKYYYAVAGYNAQGEGLLSNEDYALATDYTIITYGDPYSEAYTVYNAFDDNTGTHYDGETDDAWIGLDFGTNNAQQVLGVSFVLRNYNSAVQFATNAQFQGANEADWSDAVTLHTVAAPLLGNPAWNSYEVTDPTFYRYVRLMTAPQLRSKSFAEVKFLTSVDFTSNGTLKSWLDEHYDIDAEFAGDYEVADASDTDGDGLTASDEYVAGTDPTDPSSVLVVNSIESATNGLILSWQSIEGKSYSIITNTSLAFPAKGVAHSGIVGLPDETSFTGTVSGAEAVFFEVGVE